MLRLIDNVELKLWLTESFWLDDASSSHSEKPDSGFCKWFLPMAIRYLKVIDINQGIRADIGVL